MRRRGLFPALLGVGLVAAGCGGHAGISKGTDLANGRAKFNEAGCGGCHTLAAAGSTGAVGPNLDSAFGPAREQGFQEITFEQVVREQIRIPGIDSVMQPDLVEGKDADDVAFFVAHCAGNTAADCAPPDGAITATEGNDVFAQAGCGSCHTLAAAGAAGTIGPNLDQTQPGLDLVVDRVTSGSGAMPAFADRLDADQIQAVAQYVADSAGK